MTSTQLLKPVADGLAKSHPGYSNSDLERAYVAAEKAHSGQLKNQVNLIQLTQLQWRKFLPN